MAAPCLLVELAVAEGSWRRWRLEELATGNTEVMSLQWDAAGRCLLASSDSRYCASMGGAELYGAVGRRRWPRCQHAPDDFPRAWDAGGPMLLRYAFGEGVDPEEVPAWGASEGEEEPEIDEEEEAHAGAGWVVPRPGDPPRWRPTRAPAASYY